MLSSIADHRAANIRLQPATAVAASSLGYGCIPWCFSVAGGTVVTGSFQTPGLRWQRRDPLGAPGVSRWGRGRGGGGGPVAGLMESRFELLGRSLVCYVGGSLASLPCADDAV